jgi:hypothetical protein
LKVSDTKTKKETHDDQPNYSIGGIPSQDGNGPRQGFSSRECKSNESNAYGVGSSASYLCGEG